MAFTRGKKRRRQTRSEDERHAVPSATEHAYAADSFNLVSGALKKKEKLGWRGALRTPPARRNARLDGDKQRSGASRAARTRRPRLALLSKRTDAARKSRPADREPPSVTNAGGAGGAPADRPRALLSECTPSKRPSCERGIEARLPPEKYSLSQQLCNVASD